MSNVIPRDALAPLGYAQYTTTASAFGLNTAPDHGTATLASTGATIVEIAVEAQGVRFRDDGNNPTASVGMPLSAGTIVEFSGAAQLAALKFIQQVSGTILNVSYYAPAGD